MVLDEEALGAFGAPMQDKGKGKGKDEPKAKRVCLRHYDLPPAQLLNPMGESGLGNIALEKYWELLCKGNEKATHFSNLCFEEPKRVMVGLSQAAEVLSKACNRFLHCDFLPKLLQEEVLKAIRVEATSLLPSLLIINQGDSAKEIKADSLRQAAYAGGATAVTTEDATKRINAIYALYAWLQNPKSHLRGAMAMLSAGGVFFVAQAHERSIRAYMKHGGGTKEKFVEAMQTRGSAETSILQAAPASYDVWS